MPGESVIREDTEDVMARHKVISNKRQQKSKPDLLTDVSQLMEAIPVCYYNSITLTCKHISVRQFVRIILRQISCHTNLQFDNVQFTYNAKLFNNSDIFLYVLRLCRGWIIVLDGLKCFLCSCVVTEFHLNEAQFPTWLWHKSN